MAVDAIEGYLEILREDGIPIPVEGQGREPIREHLKGERKQRAFHFYAPFAPDTETAGLNAIIANMQKRG